jgi:hypothetical protein
MCGTNRKRGSTNEESSEESSHFPHNGIRDEYGWPDCGQSTGASGSVVALTCTTTNNADVAAKALGTDGILTQGQADQRNTDLTTRMTAYVTNTITCSACSLAPG